MVVMSELHTLIDEREAEGLFRINRKMFTDPAIFELEMKHIFEGSWVYLAHEDQLPKPNDFLTGHLGRQPIVLTRRADGSLGGFLNACQHRGAVLEQRSSGNKKLFVCPFHSWSYRNDGKLVSCGDVGAAGYGSGFDKAALGLKPIARVESYRGFIFGCLNENVQSLSDYLGEAKTFIDLIVDQDTNGEIEIIPGPQTYTYDGNWKLQAENGVDGYHVGTIHGNYVLTTNNRTRIAGDNEVVKPLDVGGFSKLAGGYYAFENGHAVLWNELPNPEVRPSYILKDQYIERFGKERAHWMTNTWRNLFIFPNLFLMDQMSSQIRTFRPLGMERTEVRAFAFAPKSESPRFARSASGSMRTSSTRLGSRPLTTSRLSTPRRRVSKRIARNGAMCRAAHSTSSWVQTIARSAWGSGLNIAVRNCRTRGCSSISIDIGFT